MFGCKCLCCFFPTWLENPKVQYFIFYAQSLVRYEITSPLSESCLQRDGKPVIKTPALPTLLLSLSRSTKHVHNVAQQLVQINKYIFLSDVYIHTINSNVRVTCAERFLSVHLITRNRRTLIMLRIMLFRNVFGTLESENHRKDTLDMFKRIDRKKKKRFKASSRNWTRVWSIVDECSYCSVLWTTYWEQFLYREE